MLVLGLSLSLGYMRLMGLCVAALFLFPIGVCAAAPPDCASGAKTFIPCELSFEWKQSDLPPSTSLFRDDVLRVEFRSPSHQTILMHAFADGPLRVRFSPTEPGQWAYHVLSDIARHNDRQGTFAVADSGLPGMVNVANLRHWRSTDKKPHLWLAASAPFLTLDQAGFETWLDVRKRDGFTHIRGPLLTGAGLLKPFDAAGSPNAPYFAALDDRLLAAANRGFTLDLLLADRAFAASGFFADFDKHEAVIRYLVARYGGLNVTWQGIQDFEDVPNSRALLRDLGSWLQKEDGFNHPRSTGARDSTFPLDADGWLNYNIEASADPQLGAVEHQFTQQPEIHVIRTSEPNAFRHELWNATTNGEYPSVSYESTQNEANVRAIQTWSRILAGTRHWEFEPYFDVSGARAVGLNEVEYLAYAQDPGIVEINLPHHKYNPLWINPATGEELEMKDYRGEVFSRQTPDNSHDWILQVPRNGEKESRNKYYYFESEDPPVQEIETDTTKVPFEIVAPKEEQIGSQTGTAYAVKLTRLNRASRRMAYAWWGGVIEGGAGLRLLGLGASGNLSIPKEFFKKEGAVLNLRVLAINANGKAYELDKVYQLAP